MKVIKELIHYLYWDRQLLSFDEYDQVMEVVTPGRNKDEYENYDDRWTTDQVHGPYKALWRKEDLWEEQILEALDRREMQRGYNRKRRSPKSGLKQRRARTLKPKDKTRLTLSGLVDRIAERAPAWAPNLQAVAILNRELDPNGFFRKADAEDHAAPMYERIPMAPLLNRFSRPEVVAALDGTLSERILPATALVRFLSFKGPRNLVKLHRDKGGRAWSWVLCCDETERVHLDDPKIGIHTSDPWVLWANDIMNVQRLLLNVCCKMKENQKTLTES